jgi:hypothetical protein
MEVARTLVRDFVESRTKVRATFKEKPSLRLSERGFLSPKTKF